jgi:hypothetical protein
MGRSESGMKWMRKEMPMWKWTWMTAVLVGMVVAGPAAAKRNQAEAPAELQSADALVEAASLALGGAKGGHEALLGLDGYRLIYTMEVHDPRSGADYTAHHVYTQGLDGSVDLEVKAIKGKGVDSVAHSGADGGWVEVDGERTEFAAAEVLQRVDDFSPSALFQVPLELAPRGIAALPEEVRGALVSEWLDAEDHAKGIVVRSSSEADQEQVRMVLEVGTHLPLEASFASAAGAITYAFGDYRQVSEGLMVPFERRFSRNGIQLSALTVESFGVLSGKGKEQNGETQADPAGE